MLNFIDWAVGIYFFVAIAIFIRMIFIVKRYTKMSNFSELKLSKRSLFSKIIKDSFFWPAYLLMYGILELLNDLR